MKAATTYIQVPPELKGRVNNVKNRILSYHHLLCLVKKECRKDDFESLANSNIGSRVALVRFTKVRHKVSKNIFAY
jgi:hypothetical protein